MGTGGCAGDTPIGATRDRGGEGPGGAPCAASDSDAGVDTTESDSRLSRRLCAPDSGTRRAWTAARTRTRRGLGGAGAIAAAHVEHDDRPMTIVDVAAAVRRWIEAQTFVPGPPGHGVQLLDDQAARYGEFDRIALVGLIEGEWPERPRRNIFYPPSLLAALGWPTERDRRGAGGGQVSGAGRVGMRACVGLDGHAGRRGARRTVDHRRRHRDGRGWRWLRAPARGGFSHPWMTRS